jgi:HAMP domain-containing protein
MSSRTPQNFDNHAQSVPAYHYVTFPLLAINFFYALYQVVVHSSWATLLGFVVAFALVLMLFLSRMMAMTVQDRVIRLEERLRLRELLPLDLKPRIPEFTVKQLVALRFAGDDELPGLARTVLDEQIHDQKAIKRLVTNWRADHQRA